MVHVTERGDEWVGLTKIGRRWIVVTWTDLVVDLTWHLELRWALRDYRESASVLRDGGL